MYAVAVIKLIEQFEKMPGIGRKTAERLVFHILNWSGEDIQAFADALLGAKDKIVSCPICQTFTDNIPCDICASAKRDTSVICVVEKPKDIISIEKTREYNGLYHVLRGLISPMDGVGPEDIKIKELLHRIHDNDIKEIIMATNPTIEGEATAIYLARLIKPFGVLVTRLAHGIPVGGDLEYADEVTILRALEGRREL